MAKPILLVTRRLPQAVEARAVRDYEARLNPEDVPRSGADILRLANGAAAILCCPADRLDAATIAALPGIVRVIATFSVGYDHIAVEAAAAHGITVCNTPGVLSVATAETVMLLILAAARRAGERRAAGPLRPMAGLGADQLIGDPGLGQAPRHFSAWAASGREVARMAACVRHGGALPRPGPSARRPRARRDLSRPATRVFFRNVRCCPSMRRAARPPAAGSTPGASHRCRGVP